MRRLDDETIRLLKEVVDHFDKEDSTIRESQLRIWRKLKLFWEGFHQVWYSEVAHDWRIWDAEQSEDTDQAYYDKPVNIFRAYLESIIAALSVTVPPVKCFPDDADNTLDLATARAGDKIAQLIFRHNNVSLLWVHALFVSVTEGMIACYNYPKSDVKFGTYTKKTYEDVEEEHHLVTCPNCGAEMLELDNPDEFQPDVDLCEVCQQQVSPQLTKQVLIITRLVGETQEPKSRMCLEIYGGLNVKIPNYAKLQKDCPYLIFNKEINYVDAIEKYPHLHKDKQNDKKKVRDFTSSAENYEAWARLSPQYRGEMPRDVVTERNAWLRPSAFNCLGDNDDIKHLKKLFPDGVKVSLINDEFAEAKNEALDDYWTLTCDPLSDYLHHDPLGLLLVSIQEITNDLISLTQQTIEHGIPQTFADPAVLNFNAYNQTEVTPGGIYPTKSLTGNKRIGDAFYEVKTATLSGEVLPFAHSIQEMGQLVSGALPSLFGGQLEGSETASQYSMSRAQALQRLQNTWKMLTVWWKEIFGKTIPMFIKEVKEDERDVQQDEDGNFINILIRKAELEGHIGRVELESNENLPLTWSQQKDIVMTLLQSANPEILAIIGSPENLPIIREAIGLTDFYIPGEDDRDKQYDEIKLLLQSEPMLMPPNPEEVIMAAQQGMPPPQEQEIPSIEIDPDIDNHQIQFEICRKWLISEAGRLTKNDNEAGYKNVLLHAKMHLMMIQSPAQAPDDKGVVPSEKPNQNRTTPITGEANVPTIQ